MGEKSKCFLEWGGDGTEALECLDAENFKDKGIAEKWTMAGGSKCNPGSC